MIQYEASVEAFLFNWLRKPAGRAHRYRAAFHARQAALEARLPREGTRFRDAAVVRLVMAALHTLRKMRQALEELDRALCELGFIEEFMQIRAMVRGQAGQ